MLTSTDYHAGRSSQAEDPRPRFTRFKTKHRRIFVVDMDGDLMRRHASLTRGARSLYSTMRALADGKTGRLEVNGHPLDWRYICLEAETSKNTWRKYFRELIAAGLAGSERPRVQRVIGGRSRVVLGRACYFVRRQAIAREIAENQPNLLKPNSCAAQKVGPQVFSNPPRKVFSHGVGVDVDVEDVKGRGRAPSSSSPTATPQPDDDDAARSFSQPKPEPQPDKLSILRATAEKVLRLKHDAGFVEIALDRIVERIIDKGNPIGSANYLTSAFENLLASDERNEVLDELEARKQRELHPFADAPEVDGSAAPTPPRKRRLSREDERRERSQQAIENVFGHRSRLFDDLRAVREQERSERTQQAAERVFGHRSRLADALRGRRVTGAYHSPEPNRRSPRVTEFDNSPRRDCSLCFGTGWKMLPRADGLGQAATRCVHD